MKTLLLAFLCVFFTNTYAASTTYIKPSDEPHYFRGKGTISFVVDQNLITAPLHHITDCLQCTITVIPDNTTPLARPVHLLIDTTNYTPGGQAKRAGKMTIPATPTNFAFYQISETPKYGTSYIYIDINPDTSFSQVSNDLIKLICYYKR